MLETRALNAFYDESHVLRGVDLTVGRGEVVTLVGRNGAGKTTTLKSIMGIVRRRTGDITFENESIVALSSDKVARRGIGFVPEERGTQNVYAVRVQGFRAVRAYIDSFWDVALSQLEELAQR